MSENRAFDSNMELRGMILAALPYPPLPVILRRVDQDDARLGESVTQTSHDILSHLLEDASVRHTVSQNRARQVAQQEVLRCFLADIVKDGLQPVPELYKTYCDFTRRHVGTYLYGGDASAQPEIRFEPLGSVCKGDPVHLAMCRYMAGQARLLELKGGLCAQDWMCREYSVMLEIARDRIVCQGESGHPTAEGPEKDDDGDVIEFGRVASGCEACD